MKADTRATARARLDRSRPVMDARPARSADHRRAAARFLLPLGIVVAALVVHVLVVRAGERDEQVELNARAERVAGGLQRRLDEYGGVLYGVRGLFRASGHVTEREFHLDQVAREV